MADDSGGINQAARAFDAAMKETAPVRGHPVEDDHMPATEVLFENVGKLEVDEESPRKGGGDDDPEELIYDKPKQKGKSPPRNPDQEDGGDSDDDESADDDESDDGDDAEEEDEEEAAKGDDDAVLSRKVEVTVDGEPVEVTVKEALEGYVRTETFHRRMNQLDEAKKIIRRAAADAVQNYEYSTNVAKQMEAHMETMIPKEPDWDEEFKKDPAHARELQRYYEKANQFKAQMKAQTDEAYKKMQESSAVQLQAFAEEESQKFESSNRKTWSDPKKRAKDLQSMRKTGLATGFTEEELSQVYDSRMLTVLLKASKYDRMMAAKPKPVVHAKATPIPPGTGSAKQRTVQKGVTSAMKRLNRTGSLEDAAVVFDQLIARGG